MTIKRVVVNLTAEETLRLTRILLDEDKDEALAVSSRMSQASIGGGDPGSLSAGL